MRVTCKTEVPSLFTTFNTFDALAQVYNNAAPLTNTKFVFNLEKASHGDANIYAVCASIGFVLNKSKNCLDIGPSKHGYNKVKLAFDLFGYRCSYSFQRLSFYSNGTEVRILEPYKEMDFKNYLVTETIRPDWRKLIPVHYWITVKDFLLKLYHNCNEHMDCNDPVFLASSFKNDILTFTVADCGSGFLKQVERTIGIISEEQAITWAMRGNSIKGKVSGGTLNNLGKYCLFNEGRLLVISGNASVEYRQSGIHEVQKLSSPIRGVVINFSIRIYKQVLVD